MDGEKESQLKEINNAITAVLVGGQSYKLGSRQLTRADLSMLRTMKRELESELNAQGESALIDNTFVAVFDGR